MKGMPKLEEVGLSNTNIKSQEHIDIPNTVKKIFLHNNFLEEMTITNMPNISMIVVPSNKI